MQVAATLTARRAVQTLPSIRDPTLKRFIGSLTLLASLWACQSYVAVPVQPVTLVAVSQRNRVVHDYFGIDWNSLSRMWET